MHAGPYDQQELLLAAKVRGGDADLSEPGITVSQVRITIIILQTIYLSAA